MKRLILAAVLGDKFVEIAAAILIASGTGFMAHLFNKKQSDAENLKKIEEASQIKSNKEIAMYNFVITQRDNLRKELEYSEAEKEVLKKEIKALRGIIIDKEIEVKEKDIKITLLSAHQAKF